MTAAVIALTLEPTRWAARNSQVDNAITGVGGKGRAKLDLGGVTGESRHAGADAAHDGEVEVAGAGVGLVDGKPTRASNRKLVVDGESCALERALVERAQAGDQRAFRELYQLHHRTVFRYAIMPLIRDRYMAEDLLADTFVRAMENIDRFKWQGKGLLPWLIRIGKNLCLDYLRRAQRVMAWPEGLEQHLPDRSELNAEGAVGMAEMADLIAGRLAVCMGEINPRYQKVLELRLVKKIPRAEAAAQMEVSVGTLDVLLFRACKAFRKVYTKRFGDEDGQPEFIR